MKQCGGLTAACFDTETVAAVAASEAAVGLVTKALPTLARVAQRRRDRLNSKGSRLRAALAPRLLPVARGAARVPESRHVQPMLEDFISGDDTGHLGDALAGLFQAWAATEFEADLAEVLVTVAQDLVLLLPHIFPGLPGARKARDNALAQRPKREDTNGKGTRKSKHVCKAIPTATIEENSSLQTVNSSGVNTHVKAFADKGLSDADLMQMYGYDVSAVAAEFCAWLSDERK